MDLIDNNKYYDTIKIFPELKILIENFDNIKNELNLFLSNHNELLIDYSNIVKYHEKSDWKIIPIYGFDKFSKISIHFSNLVKIISSINNINIVIFSKLGKNTILNPHKGWSNYSNNVLRTQLGISVPNNSGLWVENKKYFLKNKELITFDDSKLHFAFNNDDQNDRIVLIIDILRPNNILKGKSENIVMCDELKYFIENI